MRSALIETFVIAANKRGIFMSFDIPYMSRTPSLLPSTISYQSKDRPPEIEETYQQWLKLGKELSPGEQRMFHLDLTKNVRQIEESLSKLSASLSPADLKAEIAKQSQFLHTQSKAFFTQTDTYAIKKHLIDLQFAQMENTLRHCGVNINFASFSTSPAIPSFASHFDRMISGPVVEIPKRVSGIDYSSPIRRVSKVAAKKMTSVVTTTSATTTKPNTLTSQSTSSTSHPNTAVKVPLPHIKQEPSTRLDREAMAAKVTARLNHPTLTTTSKQTPKLQDPDNRDKTQELVNSVQERINVDPLWVYKRTKIDESMAAAHLASSAIHAVGYVVTEPIVLTAKMVGKATEKICNSTPMTKRACRVITETSQSIARPVIKIGRRVMQDSGISNIAKRMHQAYVYTRDHHLPQQLEKDFLIPREVTSQYVSDSLVLSLCAVPIPIPIRYAPRSIKSEIGRRKMNTLSQLTAQERWNHKEWISIPPIRLSLEDAMAIDTQKIARDIYQILNREGRNQSQILSRVGYVIDSQMCQIEGILPNFDKMLPNFTDNQRWLWAIKNNHPSFLKQTEYPMEAVIQQFHDKPNIHLLTADKHAFIIKRTPGSEDEIVKEFIGIDFLKSLQLKHLHTPEAIALGMTQNAGWFIAKTYLPGNTFEEIAKTIGNQPLESVRDRLLNDFMIASHKAGKAVGEFQSKGLVYPGEPLSLMRKKEFHIDSFRDKLEDTNKILRDISASRIKDTRRLKTIIKRYEEAPENLSYGFGDIHMSQYTWSNTAQHPLTFGWVDPPFVVYSFDLSRRPLTSATHEYYQFLNLFDAGGIEHGLRPEEISALKRNFTLGYHSEYQGKISQGTDQFFNIYSAMETIYDLADGTLVGKQIDEKILAKLIKNLNLRI